MRVMIQHTEEWHNKRTVPWDSKACCVCGKKIGKAAGATWILGTRATDGSAEYAIDHPGEALPFGNENGEIELWLLPIGSDCLRRHPELEFAVAYRPTK